VYKRQEVQQRFYEKDLTLDGYDIAGTTLPTSMTAGDYFDLIPMSKTESLLVIADVSGHGLGAALVMAEARSFTRGMALGCSKSDPGELITQLNRRLLEDLPDNQYLTLFAVAIDASSNQLRYAGAGHLPGQILRAATDTIEQIDSCGPPAGLFPDLEYPTLSAPALAPTDALLLVTDGVVESGLPHGHDFGIQRALRCVRQMTGDNSDDVIQEILRQSQAYQGVVPRHDDMSAVLCRRMAGEG